MSHPFKEDLTDGNLADENDNSVIEDFTWALLFNAFRQSPKNPVSASAMLTGKFLQIRKVFATSSLLAEEFPDSLQYKISR